MKWTEKKKKRESGRHQKQARSKPRAKGKKGKALFPQLRKKKGNTHKLLAIP